MAALFLLGKNSGFRGRQVIHLLVLIWEDMIEMYEERMNFRGV
jgi:hypothetical protein